MHEFRITADQKRWAKNRSRAYGLRRSYILDLISAQQGRCAWSGVPLLFDAASGTSIQGGAGPHPLFAALDHSAPGSDSFGHQIVCFDLNDCKGHLPLQCFRDLQQCSSWLDLMAEWQSLAETDPNDRDAFKSLLRQGRNGT